MPRWRAGYKAGGVNLGDHRPAVPAGNFNLVEEVGVKSTLFDRQLRINADVFGTRSTTICSSPALTAPPPLGTPTTHNVPKSKSSASRAGNHRHLGPRGDSRRLAPISTCPADSDAGLSNNTGVGRGLPDGAVRERASPFSLRIGPATPASNMTCRSLGGTPIPRPAALLASYLCRAICLGVPQRQHPGAGSHPARRAADLRLQGHLAGREPSSTI